MKQGNNPAITSYYISDEFYQKLVDDYSDWQRQEREIEDMAVRDSCRRFLETEARLLQDGYFESWLEMFTDECVYWVPGTTAASDPRREVAIAFDDRRRLEDRVFRLRSPHAWSQVPASRTVRMNSNVQVFSTDDEAIVMLRSHFSITEFWSGSTRIWSGWNGHRIQRSGKDWKILVKQVNLIDCDQNLRNPSILF
jgi:3-phenylpropionate/cinnamic acid dioxygenase small subunit